MKAQLLEVLLVAGALSPFFLEAFRAVSRAIVIKGVLGLMILGCHNLRKRIV
jgi:hypothetical protein